MASFSSLQISRAYSRPLWLKFHVLKKMTRDRVYPTAWKLILLRKEPVWDIGCDLGLLGISMRGAGVPLRYRGFDSNAWKINHAKEAMRHFGFEDVGFEVARPIDVEIPKGATVCALEVFHHLGRKGQADFLEKLACAAESGSLVLLRTIFRDSFFRKNVALPREIWRRSTRWVTGGALHFPSKKVVLGYFQKRGLGVVDHQLKGMGNGDLVVVEKRV